MASTSENSSDEKKLVDIFEDGFKMFNNFDKCQEPSNSTPFQANVKRCMHIFEDATRLVSIADMFSGNETIEEVATEHLRYLLLPVLLGELTLKICGGNRSEIVRVADIYFKDFLKRCKDYKIIEDNAETSLISANPQTSQHAQMAAMVGSRHAKLQKYKEQKELEAKLLILQTAMDNENVDEDTKRNYFITILKSYILKANDELSSLEMEKQLLQHMENVKKDEPEGTEKIPKRRAPPHQPLRPVIITRDDVQKAVYGESYPSLPTFTVQEFYDQRIRDGIFPDPNKPKAANAPKALQDMTEEDVQYQENLQEEMEEKATEEDDPETLARARARDEHKDDHRRGWGNRHNRS